MSIVKTNECEVNENDFKSLSVFSKLMHVQTKLKSKKSNYNSFGKYNYRNQEDILEAVKPLLNEVGAIIMISDKIEVIGETATIVNPKKEIEVVGQRYYVVATVSFKCCKSGKSIETTAYARETHAKKGMDSAQLTGSTSSYARKYALSGLLLLDDSKDVDSLANKPEPINHNNKRAANSTTSFNSAKITKSQLDQIEVISNDNDLTDYMIDCIDKKGLKSASELTVKQAADFINHLLKKAGEKKKIRSNDQINLAAA